MSASDTMEVVLTRQGVERRVLGQWLVPESDDGDKAGLGVVNGILTSISGNALALSHLTSMLGACQCRFKTDTLLRYPHSTVATPFLG